MTLTKDDLQAIGAVIEDRVRPIVKEEVKTALADQNKFIERSFTDVKEVMKDTYVSREEFEEKYNELQSEVDDLRSELHELKQRFA